MADLTTVADVKSYLGIQALTTDDALLAKLVTSASAAVEQWCGRTFALTSYTETTNGRGGHCLILKNAPVVSVSSVTVDGVVIPPQPAVNQPGWVLDGNRLQLAGSCFTSGVQNVVVQYTAGYASTPANIAQATIDLVALKYKQHSKVGNASETIGQATVSYTFGRIPSDVQAVLAPHRRVMAL